MTILSIIQVNIESILFLICIAIWILTRVWNKENKNKYVYIWFVDLLTAGLLISDVFAIYFRGNMTSAGYYIVRIANFFNFFFLYSIILYFSFFIEILFEHPNKGKKRIFIAKIAAGITLITNLINIFVPFVYAFDDNNKYFRMTGWYINSGCLLIVIFLLATVLIGLKDEIDRSVFWILLIDVLMPFVASVVQLFIYGLSITNIVIGCTQLLVFMITFRYQEIKIRDRETQLVEYNAKLMLTQVQPHFMLNALSTIQYLCKTDSQAAADTISDLGVYIRNNMEFASTTELISFEKELSHIEKYVSIEQKRFGDRIRVIYDIKEKDFELPALSIQPLVENAIKHGISKKRSGGTVEVSTWRGVDTIHILVKDDGVGFDPEKPFSEDRVHLGLSIVTERLKRQCGGNASITSTPGKGTICEISLPIEFD